MCIRSLTTPALVIKRSNTGEADKIVTLLTQEKGKVICVAKGVRKMSSSKRAALEPGNYVKVHLIETKSMPLLTQAVLLTDCRFIYQDLSKMRQMTQVLEIVDRLFVEEEIDAQILAKVASTIQLINQPGKTTTAVLDRLSDLLEYLGYARLQDSHHASILDYVAEITEKPMKSWNFLVVKK